MLQEIKDLRASNGSLHQLLNGMQQVKEVAFHETMSSTGRLGMHIMDTQSLPHIYYWIWAVDAEVWSHMQERRSTALLTEQENAKAECLLDSVHQQAAARPMRWAQEISSIQPLSSCRRVYTMLASYASMIVEWETFRLCQCTFVCSMAVHIIRTPCVCSKELHFACNWHRGV